MCPVPLFPQPPGGGAEVVGGGMLEELLMGTRDLVESEEMVEVVETCVEIAFTHTTRQLLVSLTSASCQQRLAQFLCWLKACYEIGEKNP